MKKNLIGTKVKIQWKDPIHDWHDFVIVDVYKKGWIKIKGIQADDGTPHDGSEIIIHPSETLFIVPIEK